MLGIKDKVLKKYNKLCYTSTHRVAPDDFLVTVNPNGLFLNLTS